MSEAPKEKARTTLLSRVLWIAAVVIVVLSLYVLSVGPVMAMGTKIWGRTWPPWFSNTVDVVYYPIRWASMNVPKAHILIDRYVNWWLDVLDA